MSTTIVGTGKMARAIATRLLAGGHSVVFSGRRAEAAEELAAELRPSAGGVSATSAPFGGPVAGEVVVLAVPYGAAASIIEDYGSELDDKLIVDITNPLTDTYDALLTPPDTSGAEEIARVAPEGAKVVKAFNTAFARTLEAGEVAGQPLDVFVAGDDEESRAKVSGLIEAGGMRAVDTGPLERARQLEGLALLHITLQPTLGTDGASAIKILA